MDSQRNPLRWKKSECTLTAADKCGSKGYHIGLNSGLHPEWGCIFERPYRRAQLLAMLKGQLADGVPMLEY